MSRTQRGVTRRTLAALTMVVLGLGSVLIGVVGTASASDHGNGKGANQSGPFDPHDVGGGEKQGKGNAPANGTVGKADGKNPPGQVDNPHSRGYECNSNKGIGNKGGNPAHSGCSAGGGGPTVLPTQSTAPGGGPSVMPTERSVPGDPNDPDAPAAAGDDPEVLGIAERAPVAAAPTAVDAGLTGAGSSSSTPWTLLGAALAVAGVALGFVPATGRGKRSV